MSTPRSDVTLASKRNEAPARFGREGIPLSVILIALALLIALLALVYAWSAWVAEKKGAWERTQHASELLAYAVEQNFDTHLVYCFVISRTTG